MTSQPRHTEPLPLGGDGVPYSKGLMARALTAVGVPTMRAHDLARRVEEDLRARGETVGRSRPDRRACRRRRRDGPSAPVLRAARARPAGDRPARRSDGHGEVHRCDRARLPARDHARDVHGLHPTDDARVLLARLHALDPLLQLRGGGGAARARGGGRPCDRGLPRPVAERARRRARLARPRARGGLVDGARGRPPRARPRRAAARGRAGRRRALHPRDRGPGGPRDALLRPRHLLGRRSPGRPVPRPLRRDQADPGRARHARATRRRCGDRVRERRRSRHARARPRAARAPSKSSASRERTAALPVRVVRARDGACCARRRPLARPRRRRGRRGGDLLRDARLARRAADQRTHRDRRARGRGAAAGRARPSEPAARRPTSRWTRSRGAESSRAGDRGRCR